MSTLKHYAVAILIGMLLFSGCGSKIGNKETKEFNKPAIEWYQQIAQSIADGFLDKADSLYISLKSEHAHSPLLKTATLMLAHAHMQKEEYLLSTFYLDEYNKRFGNYETYEYIAFLKLKASFLGVKDVYKDQKLILDSIHQAETYLMRYPNSPYAPMAQTIRVRLMMAQYMLNENIASLYDRIGKQKAAEIYRAKNEESVLQLSDIEPPKQSIIGKIFD